MPDIKTDEEKQKEKEAADAAAAATKEAADKKAADDAAAATAEETVTLKRSDWEKTNRDLENYKTGLLNKKAAERSLSGSDEGGTAAVAAPAALDEKKVREIATQASQATTHKANEKSAIKMFLKDHTEYSEDKSWAELVAHLPANINKDDQAAIVDALEGAVLLHKRSTGQLDAYISEQSEKAKREAEMNAQVNLGFSGGGNGGKTNNGNQADKLPESTVEMGKRFGHTAESLEKGLKEIPKNPEGGFSIDITRKNK